LFLQLHNVTKIQIEIHQELAIMSVIPSGEW
jgi:hypothetical protein